MVRELEQLREGLDQCRSELALHEAGVPEKDLLVASCVLSAPRARARARRRTHTHVASAMHAHVLARPTV